MRFNIVECDGVEAIIVGHEIDNTKILLLFFLNKYPYAHTCNNLLTCTDEKRNNVYYDNKILNKIRETLKIEYDCCFYYTTNFIKTNKFIEIDYLNSYNVLMNI